MSSPTHDRHTIAAHRDQRPTSRSRDAIGTRLIVGYLTVITLFAFASLISIISIVELGRAYALEEHLDHLKHAGHELSIRAGDMYRQQERIIHGDRGNIDRYATARDKTLANARSLTTTVPTPLAPGVTTIVRLTVEMDTLFREQILPAVHNDRAEEAAQLEHRSRAMVEQVMHLIDDLITALAANSAAAATATAAIVPRAVAVVLSCLAVAIAVAVVLGLRMTRAIERPVMALKRGAERIAAGHLDTRVDPAGPHEIIALAESFNQMAHDLAVQQHELVEARKLAAIGQLGAGFAHEINNPLGVIHGRVRLLQERIATTDTATHDALRVIRAEVELSRRTVQELLDLARPLRSVQDDIDIASLIADVFARIDAATTTTDFSLNSSVSPPTLCVKGDPDRLRQLLSNLVTNAVQSCVEPGRVTVTVSATTKGTVVEIAVSDDGGGIPVDDLPKIFDPFYSRRAGGTGLGLFLSDAIVRAHGGRIRAASEPGRGTTMTVVLPQTAVELEN